MIVIGTKSADSNNQILSIDKTAAITISNSGFFFLNLKTKQGKIIGKTRAEAIQHLKEMDKIDEFPDL